jgi:UDP-glucose 4-epimerase
MRRVFVTGASTWTGGHLVRRLSQRADLEVFAVDNRKPVVEFDAPFEELSLERLSLARYMLEVEPDTIVHLQSVHPTAEEGRNTDGEERVVGALALFGAIERLESVRSVIVKSDTAFYGASPRNPSVLSETTRPQGRPSRFQRDLTEMERFVTDIATRHDSIRYTILRFAPIFGPNVKNPISRYLTLKVVPTLLGFDPRIQLINEDDAVRAVLHALDSEIEGTFNIAAPGQLYLSRILRLGKRIPQPLPGRLFDSAVTGLARADLAVPAHLQDILKHGRVTDTTAMTDVFRFTPDMTCRRAVLAGYGITGGSA